MTQPAIRVENLGKEYQIGARENGYKTFREAISETVTSPLRRFKRLSGRAHQRERFWALKDVSFDVQPGEAVGIIGRNGAGKSTLLKILSRITEPTTGRAKIHGRVGSLLEVGTGFHPELTGRENVFLNGAVLGMSRSEIKRKFDEIVDFSGVETFLDTPVKRYSTGMRVRLAFAVAAHLEPEILIVDEVLAVGDAEFQKKCLGKMGDVATGGRTVLFVSHNMAALEALCNRCILLSHGRVVANGETFDVVGSYRASTVDECRGVQRLAEHPGRRTGCHPMMKEVILYSDGRRDVSSLPMGAPLSVEVSFRTSRKPIRPVLGVVVKSVIHAPVFGVDNRFIPGAEFTEPVFDDVICCSFERLPLMPGQYSLDLYLGDEQRSLDVIYDAISFVVSEADVYGTGRIPPALTGPIFWHAKWSLRSQHVAAL